MEQKELHDERRDKLEKMVIILKNRKTKKKFPEHGTNLLIFLKIEFSCTKLNFGVSQCISGHVISQNIEIIRFSISQLLLKIEIFGLDQKFSEFKPKHFTILGSSSAFLVT